MRPRSRVRSLVTSRRTIALLVVAGIGWLGYCHVVPEIAAIYMRRELAASGYPDAELHIAKLGINHTQITGLVLRPGLELGDVGVDVGLSYLWGHRAHELTSRGARIDAAALSGTGTGTGTGRPRKLPAPRIRVDDAQLTVGDTQVAVTGQTAPAPDGTIELTFEATAREGGRPAWSAKGSGRVTVASKDLAIREVTGRADVAIPTGELGSIAFTDARVSLDVARTVTGSDSDAWKLRVSSGRARFAGGELSVDPFDIVKNRPIDVVVRGRGLQLAKLPGRGKFEASGLVDGRLALRVDGSTVSPLAGELHARAGGRLRVSDPVWRRKVAGTAGKGLAIRERVAGALTDLDYSKLTVTLAPPGTGPEVRIAVSGRGHDLRQELHLEVNLRGIRDMFHRFTKSTPPRSPH